MASIRKRGNKWQVQVRRYGHQLQTKTFQQKRDAEAWARHIETQIDRRALPVGHEALDEVTLADLLYRYRDTVTPRKRSAPVENYRIGRLLRDPLAATLLSQIDAPKLADYRDRRLSVVRYQAVRHDLNLLSHVLKTAASEWDLPVPNPVPKIWRPPISEHRERRLNEGEFEQLAAAATEHEHQHLLPLARLALATGMRRGELLRIRDCDVSWQTRTLFVPTSKTGTSRSVPLSQIAIEVLRSRTPDANGYLFPITDNAVKLGWRRLVRRAGIEDLHFHDLRHEAISRFFERGLNVVEVGTISGHRELRMLKRYTHLRAQSLAERLD